MPLSMSKSRRRGWAPPTLSCKAWTREACIRGPLRRQRRTSATDSSYCVVGLGWPHCARVISCAPLPTGRLFISADVSRHEPLRATRSGPLSVQFLSEILMMLLHRLLALGLILGAPCLSAATLPPGEPMPTLDASALAPAALLNAAGYTVDPTAPVVGYMGQFTLRASAGTLNANGTGSLAVRVDEL